MGGNQTGFVLPSGCLEPEASWKGKARQTMKCGLNSLGIPSANKQSHPERKIPQFKRNCTFISLTFYSQVKIFSSLFGRHREAEREVTSSAPACRPRIQPLGHIWAPNSPLLLPIQS